MTPLPNRLSESESAHSTNEQPSRQRNHFITGIMKHQVRYDDLFPYEVSQLASVLCHAPPVDTPRDGAVWTAYVCHTNERIALLSHRLRAATTLPSFLPWSTNHGLCSIHRRLNAKPLEDIFAALRYEVEVRTQEIWQPVALAGGLSASQTQHLALMEELQSLWLTPSAFMEKFSRLPSPRYAHQADECVACVLARMGANVKTAMALGALLLGSMRRSDMLSTRVCFCREWVRYTVEGDIDCVDAALSEMELMGTRFREARKWARWRAEATSEHGERGLGLGGMPNVQLTRKSRCQEEPDLDGRRHHQRAATASPQRSSPQLPLQPYSSAPALPKRYSAEQHSPELPVVYPPPADLHSPEQYFSAHNSDETTSSETLPSTTINTLLPNSPASLYSEFVTNPFLDGSSSPSPVHDRQLPPDLPFRLFERRRAYSNDGSPSPPKNAVQWPNRTPRTQQSTAERFKDGLVQVPYLARLETGDRNIGALWKKRAEKMTVNAKGNR
ncbi:hypothetical protein M436DRAFT_68735 [Aureobasidium namibiae CBS 147.97]|uniref:Uncharacterized protein n=1 Tax=Aureobasidium namibiae CBS 147.97 TaxID=1043004 RepID=A0A074WWG1_9PEZI|nr:uncharacterized protein M436DRAFT_68735 [Aureobasidium namibiae CBS 147.97]KEQ77545.1 hypothetical protein M436DRAFT_68735 [Aureobasidium namibiae CBS 147.97]